MDGLLEWIYYLESCWAVQASGYLIHEECPCWSNQHLPWSKYDNFRVSIWVGNTQQECAMLLNLQRFVICFTYCESLLLSTRNTSYHFIPHHSISADFKPQNLQCHRSRKIQITHITTLLSISPYSLGEV